MPPVSVYLSNEDFLLHKKLTRGEASKLFQHALREHIKSIENPEGIDKRLASLNETKKEIEEKVNRLEQRKIALAAREQDLLKTKEDMERTHQERIKSFLASWNSDFKAITGRDMTEQDMDDYKSYVVEQREDNKFVGMFEWLAHLKEIQ